jgi:rhamnulokinase
VSPSPTTVVAVDLGATSVRVARVDLDAPAPVPEVVHRWPHGPVRQVDGTLRWDWTRLVAEVRTGLTAAFARGPVASIGIDGWAVDHGLLDGDGTLLSTPFSYRDTRTEGYREVVERIGAQHLYERTGIQLMPINTIFQLAAHDRDELARARTLLLLPDLLTYHLTGAVIAERSNASTTALLDAHTGGWSHELLDAIGVDPGLMPPLVDAGQPVGSWQGVPIHTVGSHDTASAFVAVPGVPGPGTAVVSAGTWVLAGTERATVDTSAAARAANLSNEGGALGGVRFLRNVVGFWLLERCRAAWGDPPIEELVAAAEAVEGPVPVLDARDERFVSPDDMEAELRAASGLGPDAPRDVLVRCIVESIAATTATVLDELAAVTGDAITEVHAVGGGVRMDLLNRRLAHHTGVPVTVGSSEATAIGNAVVQGIAIGRFGSLDVARRWVATGATTLAPDGARAAPDGARTAQNR